MSVDKRIVAGFGAAALVVAGALAAPAFFPSAMADDAPSHLLDSANDLFAPPKFDARSLKKFDIAMDDSVSTEVSHRELISKIAGGYKTIVSVVTTPTGTYSSDALVSPNVSYPGITVTTGDGERHRDKFFHGSATTPWGTQTWSSVTIGSFTYFHSNFERART